LEDESRIDVWQASNGGGEEKMKILVERIRGR
jgi:hypothetical protein